MSDGWGDDNVDAAVTSQGGDEGRGGGSGCRKCGDEGHYAKECPQGGGDGGCRKCGEEGHFAKECPQRAPGDNKCRNCREVRKRKIILTCI